MADCEHCKGAEATIALQYIASDKPSRPSIGWHYRGFPQVKLCDRCSELDDAALAQIYETVLTQRAERKERRAT